MVKRLLHRNVLLLIGVVLAGQMLAAAFVFAFVLQPQTTRIAQVTATLVSSFSNALNELPRERRAVLLSRLDDGEQIRIRPANNPPSDGPFFPSLIELQFMNAMAAKLSSQDKLVWRTDMARRLWILIDVGGDNYWVSITPSRMRGPMTSTAVALLSALVVSLAGGILLQRRLDRPLRALARAADCFDPDRPAPTPLAEDGPEEVSAVAGAFNRMTLRLAEQQAERAVMLAGVSHDLRTPLTRLRLSLALMKGVDKELEDSATRQIDQIESMLTQFLDFARGMDSEEAAWVSVRGLLEEVAEGSISPAAIQVTADPALRWTLRPGIVARALDNLVRNALRHGRAPIELIARGNDQVLTLMVRDHGPGVDAATFEGLRRPFVRGDSARGGAGGTGLGLAIVDQIMRSEGGWLSSLRDAAGFAVVLTLPKEAKKAASPVH